jgi:hypothetical protein
MKKLSEIDMTSDGNSLRRAGSVSLKLSEETDGQVRFTVYPPNLRQLLEQVSLEALLNLRIGIQHLLADVDATITRQNVTRQEQQKPEADHLLSPEEAAKKFNVNKRWLLERTDEISGAKRLSRKVIRFSEKPLARYLSGGKA